MVLHVRLELYVRGELLRTVLTHEGVIDDHLHLVGPRLRSGTRLTFRVVSSVVFNTSGFLVI